MFSGPLEGHPPSGGMRTRSTLLDIGVDERVFLLHREQTNRSFR